MEKCIKHAYGWCQGVDEGWVWDGGKADRWYVEEIFNFCPYCGTMLEVEEEEDGM